MLNRYHPAFTTLTHTDAFFVASALGIVDQEDTPENITGEDLYERCEASGYDQASVVVALAGSRSPMASAIIAHLMGKPIRKCHVGESGLDPLVPEQTAFKRAKPSSPRSPKSDPRIVVSVAPNPKRVGSATHGRYAFWVVGESVGEAMARGLTPADVAHDIKKGFVVLEGAQ